MIMSHPAWLTPTPLRRLAADAIVWELIGCCSPENWPYDVETNYEAQNDDYFMSNDYDEEEDDSDGESEPENDINNDNDAPFVNVNNENAAQVNNLNNQDILIDAGPQEMNENDIADNALNEPMQNENGVVEVENIPNPNHAENNDDDINREGLENDIANVEPENINENLGSCERLEVNVEDEQSVSGSSTSGVKVDLDLILLASGHGKVNYRGKKFTNREDLNRHLNAKIWVLKKLRKLKKWWDSTDILGPLHSNLQQQLREAFYENLQFYGDLPHLYNFLLQVLFSSETGLCLPSDINTNDERDLKRVGLGATSCKVLANVIKSLGPFTLEHLLINTIKFINISPLLAILSNSPFVKTIDIKDCPEEEDIFKCSPEILKCISKCCPLVEVLEIDYTGMVPILKTEEDYIYEIFFGGMKKEKVMENIGCNDSVGLSFPCLKKTKLVRIPKDFLGNLSFLYIDLKNVDYTFSHKNFPKNPCYLKNVQFTSELLNCMTVKGTYKIKSFFPKMKHLTIYHNCENMYKSTLTDTEMCRNLSAIVIEGNVSSLCLKVDDFYQDERSYPDLSPYFLSFEKVGSSLEKFTLIISLCDVKSLARIINECTHALSIKVILPQRSIPFSAQTVDFQLKSKPNLKSLTLFNEQDTYHDATCRSQFNIVVKSFLEVSPNIETLEIDAREIRTVLDLINKFNEKRADGFYNHITTLTLVRDIMWYERYHNKDLGYGGTGQDTKFSSWMIDNIKNLIESLPRLKKVILYFQLWDFLYFRYEYRATALKFIHGKTHLPKGNNVFDYNC